MEVKTLEVRDEGTFLPVMAINLGPRDEAERWLFARAGYGLTGEDQSQYVILVRLEGMECRYGPCDWLDTSPRTLVTAHQWIVDNWHDLTNGDVVDVSFILGETVIRKVSERLESSANPTPHSTYVPGRWPDGIDNDQK